VCHATYRACDCGRAIGVLVQEVTIKEEQEWQPAAWLSSADKVASTSLAEELERVGQCVCHRCLMHADASNHSETLRPVLIWCVMRHCAALGCLFLHMRMPRV